MDFLKGDFLRIVPGKLTIFHHHLGEYVLELVPSIEESQIQVIKKGVLPNKKKMQALMKFKQKSNLCLEIIMINFPDQRSIIPAISFSAIKVTTRVITCLAHRINLDGRLLIHPFVAKTHLYTRYIIPNTEYMIYLPTFTIKLNQM